MSAARVVEPVAIDVPDDEIPEGEARDDEAREAAFADALEKGLGRAHEMLEAAPPTDGMVDLLVEASLTSCLYDAQGEGTRAPYLRDLVVAAGQSQLIGEILAVSLDGFGTDEQSLDERWRLAGLLARDGDAELAAAMREALITLAGRGASLLPDEGDWSWMSDVWSFDTEPARQVLFLGDIYDAVFAIEQLARVGEAGPDAAEASALLDEARSRLGAELDLALDAAAEENEELAAFLRTLPLSNALGSTPADDPSAVDREAAKHEADAKWAHPWSWARQEIANEIAVARSREEEWLYTGTHWREWGRRAPEAELRRAAECLAETVSAPRRAGSNTLLAYLSVFRARRWPLDPEPLIRLLHNDCYVVTDAAAKALSLLTGSSAVRRAALETADDDCLRAHSIELLASNWQPEDIEVVLRVLMAAEDPDELHEMGFGLRRVIRAQPSPAIAPLLVAAVERGPCPACRHGFLKVLLALGSLPEALRAECRWDSYLPTRDLVAAPPA